MTISREQFVQNVRAGWFMPEWISPTRYLQIVSASTTEMVTFDSYRAVSWMIVDGPEHTVYHIHEFELYRYGWSYKIDGGFIHISQAYAEMKKAAERRKIEDDIITENIRYYFERMAVEK